MITFSQITLCAVPSSTKHLSEMREIIKRCVSHPHIPERVAFQIVLAVDEAVSNAILHSCDSDASQKVELSMTLDEDKLQVTVRNEGPYFDPTHFSSETMTEELKERRRPTLGIKLMKKIFDEMQYRRSGTDGNTNELTLVKYLADVEESPETGGMPSALVLVIAGFFSLALLQPPVI